MDKEENKEKIFKLVKYLFSSNFWGVLEIRFENGIVVNIRKTENIKP